MKLLDVPLFDEAACADIVQRLERCRDRWVRRQRGFFTVGRAAYLDVCRATPEAAHQAYYGCVAASNQLLAEQFGDVLDTVRTAVSRILGAPARFESKLAFPGFHVFEEGGITTREQPSSHFDHQHRSIRWPFELREERLLSFTLAVRLPRLGGGLDVWDIVERDVERMIQLGRSVSLDRLSITKPRARHEYVPGQMTVQLVPCLHRIAMVPRVYAGDQRITLQGHGIIDTEGTWVLYW